MTQPEHVLTKILANIKTPTISPFGKFLAKTTTQHEHTSELQTAAENTP
jgi:hypothetical protein